MSIIIPSKNIYGLQNQKIRKNKINGTSTTITEVVIKNEELKNASFSFYSEEMSQFSFLNYVLYSKNYESLKANNGVSNIEQVGSDGEVNFRRYRFEVNSDKYVIKNSLTAVVTLKYRKGESYTDNLTRGIPAFYSNNKLSDFDTVSRTIKVGEDEKAFSKTNGMNTAGSEILIKTRFNEFDGDRCKNFSIDIYFPIYCFDYDKSHPAEVNGFVVTDASARIMGDVYDFSSEKGYSYGTDPIMDFTSNEFFQNNVKYDGKNFANHISQNIVSKHKDGKETASVLCSISDYYDENGEKKISVSGDLGKMCFSIGDRVCPMVLDTLGKDRPISYYQNGEKKEFFVRGVNTFYDGAVWQELTLQEAEREEQ